MKILASMLVLTVASIALADESAQQGALTTSVVLNKLHAINQHEIEGGRMAQAHADTPEVRAFGERMVKDHSEADAAVTKLAGELQVTITNPMRSDLPATDKEAMKREMTAMRALSKVSGIDFDRRYLSMMSAGHAGAITFLEKAQTEATDPKVRDLVVELLPTVQGHKQLADDDLRSLQGEGHAQR